MTVESTERLIAIIEERTRNMAEDIKDARAELVEVRKETREAVQRLHVRLDGEFVSQRQFWPVQALVYGGAGLILLAVLGALVALVIKR